MATRKDVIIYDAFNGGKDWQRDMLDKWKAQDEKAKEAGGKAEVLVIAKDGETSLAVNSETDEMLAGYNTLRFHTVKKTGDPAIDLGLLVFNNFRHGLYGADSTIYINSPSDAVLSAGKLATLLAVEYIKPEDRLRVVLGKISFYSNTLRVFDTKDTVIMGPDADSEES